MRNIEWYVEEAQKNTGLNSLNKLAPAVGISTTSLSLIVRKRSFPADETMISLAKLAGVDEQTALMDLNVWRAPTPSIKKVYANILHKLSCAAMLVVLLFVSFVGTTSPASAAYQKSNSVFMENSVIPVMENNVEYILWKI